MAAQSSVEPSDAAVYRKVAWRLIPFLFGLYIIAYLDRVNVGYAKLQMAADLGFSDAIYGLGAGIFFVGYFLFEVPSNLLLERFGARLWIARIVIVWGAISASFMFVETPTQFYALRFCLGVAEAGFFPGIILYLTYWFPAAQRVRMIALFMTAVAVSGVIGGPVSGWIMQEMAGLHGMAGWQWLFLIEGIPAILAGVATLAYLDDGPRKARWLTEAEKRVVERALEEDHKTRTDDGHVSFKATLGDGRFWLLAVIDFSIVIGIYGVSFFLPQLIKDMGVKDLTTNGLLSAIPNGVAAIVMVVNGHHSDKTMERRWHTAAPAVIAGLGLVAAAYFGRGMPVASMIALTVATAGSLCAVSVFWSLPTMFLAGTAAAGGIALINSVGNIGGFVGPYLMGWSSDKFGSSAAGLYTLGGLLIFGGVLVVTALRVRRSRTA